MSKEISREEFEELVIKYTKKIAIANKEAIICGWHLINGKIRSQ